MPNRYAIDKNLTVGDLRFHYRDWGGHGWPVLLLHDLGATAHIWDLAAPLLVDSARVLALDLRGHGESTKPDAGYGFAEVAQDVAGVIAGIDLGHPVVVGHGWGAHVALWLAAKLPETLAGLILVDGGVVDHRAVPHDEMIRRLKPPDDHAGLPVERFRELIIEDAPQGLITPAVEAAIMANVEIDAQERVNPRLPRAAHLEILETYRDESPASYYPSVVCPVLIVPTRHTELDHAGYLARKERGVEAAQTLLADVEVRWLEDCIHDAPLQYPHLLAEEVRRFLQERV